MQVLMPYRKKTAKGYQVFSAIERFAKASPGFAQLTDQEIPHEAIKLDRSISDYSLFCRGAEWFSAISRDG